MTTYRGPYERARTPRDTQGHRVVSIMAPTDGGITKALAVKGQMLP